jgi:hypothetical protein
LSKLEEELFKKMKLQFEKTWPRVLRMEVLYRWKRCRDRLRLQLQLQLLKKQQ